MINEAIVVVLIKEGAEIVANFVKVVIVAAIIGIFANGSGISNNSSNFRNRSRSR